ncbi:hypothetical protein LTR15_010989 [Elasticomyces elasticus]|nr:hypothetical protein LTR15_010989 [Elasticomyces elasticus]
MFTFVPRRGEGGERTMTGNINVRDDYPPFPNLEYQAHLPVRHRAFEARAALVKYWDRMSDLANEDNLRGNIRSRHATNRQVQHPRQQEACECIVAFVARKEIFRQLIRDTFGLKRGEIMFCKKCSASRNVKGQIENVVYLSTLGPVKDLSLMWCREFFSWEDLDLKPELETGKFIEGCQTPSCLAIGHTPHRASDSIIAEAEGEPEHMIDGVIPSLKRWIIVKGITVNKGRSKITAPENALFLPRIPQMLLQSGNTGDNAVVIVSRMLERKPGFPQNGTAESRQSLVNCSRAQDPVAAFKQSKRNAIRVFRSPFRDYWRLSGVAQMGTPWDDAFNERAKLEPLTDGEAEELAESLA